MDIRQITPRFYASPQIDPSDMGAIKEAGITLILCNRPDAEVPPSVIAHNREISVAQDEVVLGYCASGTRSTIAWALGQAGKQPADTLIEAARAGGYDLSHMRDVLSAPYA